MEARSFLPLWGDGDRTGHHAFSQAPLAAELQCSSLYTFVAFCPLSGAGETEKWFLFFSTFCYVLTLSFIP